MTAAVDEPQNRLFGEFRMYGGHVLDNRAKHRGIFGTREFAAVFFSHDRIVRKCGL